MEQNKSEDYQPIVYKSEEVEIDKHDITYPGKINSGGARESTVISPVKAYPLTADEYYVIKDEMPKGDWNNKQTLLLSLGVSFFYSSVIYALTTDFTITINNSLTIKWLHVIFLTLFISFSLGSLVAFFFTNSLNKKDKNKKPYDRIEDRIKDHLNIT